MLHLKLDIARRDRLGLSQPLQVGDDFWREALMLRKLIRNRVPRSFRLDIEVKHWARMRIVVESRDYERDEPGLARLAVQEACATKSAEAAVVATPSCVTLD